jgi:predicted TIM-barrel fold metal-dependent hydrolase
MITDVNLFLSRWPFRRLHGDEPAVLVSMLRAKQVRQAWAGSYDALLHRDIADVNQRLAHECREHGGGLLLPFGSVNPAAGDWEEDLRRCHEEFGMRGIRVHPNYHGYKLDHPEFAKLMSAAAERRLIVQLAVIMEDERTQHPLLRVPPVDLGPLPRLIRTVPHCRLVLINCFRTLRLEQCKALAETGNVYFEISMLEGIRGIERLLESAPLERVLFGSYAPFYYWDSAELKLRESDLSDEQRHRITQANAESLLS